MIKCVNQYTFRFNHIGHSHELVNVGPIIKANDDNLEYSHLVLDAVKHTNKMETMNQDMAKA